ncbi:DUF917 domain-containing protein [Companilactobacillus halodurans]|uniref:DUF917 domain-containing protein n=1 Tax=Companilactobacillus halodurans TaxID=2584183 RepID=A0A5P0ZYR9_9LACO|nr:DUF917 domain-containing protein [Companilactobacillus halodurans]MQS76326.1 DUF917 domain-containing protein [Companilactobacillus halodurans]MQS98180.1 DUF917 domain-containing protein [Companilactobacillus halodurans]
MSRKLYEKDINQIATGAALLGAGGGGNPYIGKLMALSMIKKNGPVTLLSPLETDDNDFFVSASSIGAPAVSMEKFPNGSEFRRSFEMMKNYYGKKISGTFPIEAGGINSMMPIIAASDMNMPIVDADGMGRAFPELQMSTFVLAGHPVTPMVLTDERGNTGLINTVSPVWAERIARNITVEMGATATMASDGLTGKELREAGVLGIVTKSQKIGQLIEKANEFNSVAEALNKLLEITNGFRLFTGKIVDIEHTTKGGFNFGETTIQGLNSDQDSTGTISFQNENIIFKVNNQILATAPDLITMVDIDTLQPVTNEEIRYGKRVHVLGLPANKQWRTPAGIKSVGPRYFKYDVDYVPIEKRYKNFVENRGE